MQTIPPLSADLIAALDKDYPARCARKGMTMEEVWMEAGARQLVEHLLHVQARQDENILEQPTLVHK